ncbi:MAG: hypothetical protein JJE46_05080 [Acidimicrobiia bacterium]|nr:hypothetical protein [Acidimicrobiia bacterium]
MSTLTPRPIRGLAIAFALTIGIAACGSSGGTKASGVASLSKSDNSKSSSSGQAKTADPAAFRKQLLAYAQCMRDNGVDFPDPQFDANGQPQFNRDQGRNFGDLRNSPAFDKARTACESKQPDFAGQFQRTPAEQAALRKNLLKFAKCMRGKGLDYPDPTFDANGRPQFNRDGAPGNAQGQNRDDPTAQAARQACQQEVGGNVGGRGFGGGLGGRGPGGGTPPGGAPGGTSSGSQSNAATN